MTRVPTIWRWGATILWAGVIWFLSAQPNLSSGLPEDYILRKMAHVTVYAILTALLMWSLHWQRRWYWLVVILTLAYASLDEWHQTWVVGRHGAWTDVAIDSIGLVVVISYAAWHQTKLLPGGRS